jgi:ribosomal protein L37E
MNPVIKPMAEGVDSRKHVHTKVEIACATCGTAYDICGVLEHRLQDDVSSEWRYSNIITKELNCKKCGNDTFRIFEVIDKRYSK